MKGQRALITGATGFLGSHLARRLHKRGWQLTLLRRKQSNLSRLVNLKSNVDYVHLETADLDQLFTASNFDLILHCATNYGRNQTDPISVIEANLMLPLKLLLLAINHKVPTFLNTDTILDKRIGDYSRSKKQFFEWMESVSPKIRCLNVSLEHFYGPGDDPSKFVSYIIECFTKGISYIDLTPGEQYRDFIFIEDVVDAFDTIIENSSRYPKGVQSFEVGSGIKIQLKDFVRTVQKVSGNQITQLNFGALPYRPNEVMDTDVNLSELLKLGWSPKVSLLEGLRRTLQMEAKA